jgi:hypothetical protein
MAFRDQPMRCPRCGKNLVRYEERDKWRCKTCYGALVGAEQLEIEVGPAAAEIVEGPQDPARPAIHPCPVCAYPMTPYTIERVEIDRCVEHRVVWFDAGEIGKIRDAVPPPEPPSLLTNTLVFIAQLRAQTAAMRAGEVVEIPLAEPLVVKPGEWEARRTCPDGACTGVVGDDGTCGVCGRAA